MKATLFGLLILCIVTDGFAMKLSECPPGYRCVPKTGRLRFVRSDASEHNDDDLEPQECRAGTYSEGGATECTPCERGTYAAYTGLPGCIDCPVGHYCPEADEDPKQCPLGSYNNQTRQTCCRSCTPGYHAPLKGMTACIRCPSGHACKQLSELECEDFDSKCAPFWKMPSRDQGTSLTYQNANTRIQGDISRSACVSFRASSSNDSQILFSIGSSDTSCDEGRGCNKYFSLAIRNATHVDIYGMCYQHTNEAIRVSQHSLYDGNSHHICVTYNNTESTLRVYLDSQVSECVLRENVPYNTGLGDVRIGWWPDNNRQFVTNDDGLIHSLSLYDHVISESCINHIFEK